MPDPRFFLDAAPPEPPPTMHHFRSGTGTGTMTTTPSPPPRRAPKLETSGRHRRQTARKHAPLLRVPEATEKPITWPEEMKWTLPVGRLIRLDSSRPLDTPFFTKLNYDVRRAIYDTILLDAGFRQNIGCPSVTRTGPVKELYGRYLISRKCDDDEFDITLACGHWECHDAKHNAGCKQEPQLRLGDLVAMMRTCKFGYLEISEHIYRSVTFTFSTFSEMRVFMDRTPESLLRNIRTVAFIAHVLSKDAKVCFDFIKGEYFQEDDMAVLKRFPKLQRLEVNFYPSLILAASNELPAIVKPLEQLQNVDNIVLRVPSMIYCRDTAATSRALPPANRLCDTDNMRLERPGVLTSEWQRGCRAYWCDLALASDGK
ncbi:hypothetical protein B0T16DRAFT_115309 [Cercophora newfieldiana]|uniref:DUF7730 domain-containing protein n=1 Tax=Cercophora newfieldiana TaxID=92897 RepID=A0AA40CTF7_9PEZI|nr:hypothetical protein B0T16DRAFT_115309 [Cercophora newfieldiana]